jgi:hypothetical protein
LEKINRPVALFALSLGMLGLGIWLFRPALPLLPATERQAIAERIYLNECGGKPENLVSWNRGEAFLSLGIGHFIWYPAGYRGPFDESFPPLIRFMRAHHARLPAWLAISPGQPAPWPDRATFTAAKRNHDPRIANLRQFLLHTTSLQAAFIADRMKQALPRMLAAVPKGRRAHIRRQFLRLARAPGGYYPLIDYVNFKGEGISPSERYQGKGWGLLQVLEQMPDLGDPLAGFAEAAAKVLQRRVRLSPPARHEARWLPGWLKRVQTYNAAGLD